MNKKEIEIKKTIDQMGGKLFEYINTALPEDEANKRMRELGASFFTATIDMNRPIDELKVELRNLTFMLYAMMLSEVINIKKGNDENIITEINKD